LCAVPVLRIGEFLIGCGAACALKKPTPSLLANGKYWILPGLVFFLYNLQMLNHGVDFLCLKEDAQHRDCSLWHRGQIQLKNSSPCITFAEKILNKYAFIFAILIHGIAREELEGKNTGWIIAFLNSEFFRCMSKFSLSLYLGHANIAMALDWLSLKILDMELKIWRDDTILIIVYATCYLLHHIMISVIRKFEHVNPPEINEYALEESQTLIKNDPA
jgi:hypothetical protein